MKDLDPRDRELLNALQNDLPLISTPYAVVGQTIDMSEKEVLKRAERMRRDGSLRHIAATFDARGIGYRSCLVAAKISDERIDHAASVVNLHPGVTQNYRRNHDYNLWFTIYIAPDSVLGLEGTLQRLGEAAQWTNCLPLATLRSFKSGENNEPEADDDVAPLTPREIEVVKLLQRELPLQPRPFDTLARASDISPEEILEVAKILYRRHQLRRISAVVQTRRHSFSASAMGVWAVPTERIEHVAPLLSNHRAVTQCFLRPTFPDWPYNVFTTVHGRSVDECESYLGEIAEESGLDDRRVLFPVKEYKRSRLNLFSGDIATWETGTTGVQHTAFVAS